MTTWNLMPLQRFSKKILPPCQKKLSVLWLSNHFPITREMTVSSSTRGFLMSETLTFHIVSCLKSENNVAPKILFPITIVPEEHTKIFRNIRKIYWLSSCWNEHRWRFPRSRSMHSLSQEDAALMACHINSLSKHSLNEQTPFDLAELLIKKSTDLCYVQPRI